MGMQILSLSMGNTAAVNQPDLHREKWPPLPMEQVAASRREEALLQGSQTSNFDLQKTTSELERISSAFNRRLKFVIDHESKEILIKVIDNETDKVIKELPPEELKRLHSRIRETIGFLFDRTV